jgi:hypothetical protein
MDLHDGAKLPSRVRRVKRFGTWFAGSPAHFLRRDAIGEPGLPAPGKPA